MRDERSKTGSVLLIGASRGLGHAMAVEFLRRGWHVTGTVRGPDRTPLHDVVEEYGDRLTIESLDVVEVDQIQALHDRLADRRFDILFVNAGTADRNQDQTIAQVSTDEFVKVMVTNALSPMRVVEALEDRVSAPGLIGVMSSGQGSVGNNDKGGHEVYRGSKAALNMCMRSYAARCAGDGRALLLLAPGWIRTDLGGPKAPFGIDETMPDIVDVIIARIGTPGLRYLDRHGKDVPW